MKETGGRLAGMVDGGGSRRGTVAASGQPRGFSSGPRRQGLAEAAEVAAITAVSAISNTRLDRTGDSPAFRRCGQPQRCARRALKTSVLEGDGPAERRQAPIDSGVARNRSIDPWLTAWESAGAWASTCSEKTRARPIRVRQ